jgi:hypothetical protein
MYRASALELSRDNRGNFVFVLALLFVVAASGLMSRSAGCGNSNPRLKTSESGRRQIHIVDAVLVTECRTGGLAKNMNSVAIRLTKAKIVKAIA